MYRRFSTSKFSNLFTDQAAAYAKFRPTYPSAVWSVIESFIGPARGLAVDLATGSGQFAVNILSSKFNKVIAIDPNEQQLNNASTASNVEYRLGTGESSGIESETADLVSVAQGLHWMDLPLFYPEVARILRPGGTYCAIGYNAPIAVDVKQTMSGQDVTINTRANDAIRHMYYDVVGEYWSSRRSLIDSEYKDLDPPPNLLTDLKRYDTANKNIIADVSCVSIDSFIGYVSTWSAYQTYLKKQGIQTGGEEGKLKELKDRMMQAVGGRDVNIRREYFVILAKK